MASRRNFGITVWLAVNLILLASLACAETTVSPTPTWPPLPAPPPTFAAGGVQTPTDFGYNTRVIDGDIHVWHAPHCPPVPPAEFVAKVILTDLRSGSQLYLNGDGSVRTSPQPDYRSDEGQERLSTVLDDSSLIELILTPFDCPSVSQ